MTGLCGAVTVRRRDEVGQIYRGDGPKDQLVAASGVRAGNAALTGTGRHWAGNAKAADVQDAKADAFALQSQIRTGRAVDCGRLAEEIVFIEGVLESDEHPRPRARSSEARSPARG